MGKERWEKRARKHTRGKTGKTKAKNKRKKTVPIHAQHLLSHPASRSHLLPTGQRRLLRIRHQCQTLIECCIVRHVLCASQVLCGLDHAYVAAAGKRRQRLEQLSLGVSHRVLAGWKENGGHSGKPVAQHGKMALQRRQARKTRPHHQGLQA